MLVYVNRRAQPKDEADRNAPSTVRLSVKRVQEQLSPKTAPLNHGKHGDSIDKRIVSSVPGRPNVAAKVDLNDPTGTRGVMMVDKLGAHVRFFDPGNVEGNLRTSRSATESSRLRHHRRSQDGLHSDLRRRHVRQNPQPGSHQVAIVDLVGKKVGGSIDVSP